jgi:hypothetical protein
MDFEQLQKDAARLETLLPDVRAGKAAALKDLATGVRDVLSFLLKDRREPIRPGQIFRDAAAKGLVPGDIAPRGDALIVRWAGKVVPQDEAVVKEDATRWVAVAEKVVPVFKAYRKKD